MQVSGSVRTALLIVAFAAPALVSAQFQPPTCEELKMTTDSAYPGAASAYLEDGVVRASVSNQRFSVWRTR